MCMSPKVPKMPKQKDPILPQQPLQATQPANLQIGRGEGEDDKKIRQHRSRRKLRISKDAAGVQAPSSGGSLSYSGG
jgi:hypothetical protein